MILGTIDPRELKAAMQSLGFEAKNQTIYQMMRRLMSLRSHSTAQSLESRILLNSKRDMQKNYGPIIVLELAFRQGFWSRLNQLRFPLSKLALIN